MPSPITDPFSPSSPYTDWWNSMPYWWQNQYPAPGEQGTGLPTLGLQTPRVPTGGVAAPINPNVSPASDFQSRLTPAQRNFYDTSMQRYQQLGPKAWEAPQGGVTGTAGSASPNPQGYGYNNPNEPGPNVANQYNNVTGRLGAGLQAPTLGGGGTAKSPGMLAGYQNLDPVLGKGWTDRFYAAHGVDPLSFYIKAFQNYPQARDNAWLEDRATKAAIYDGINHPGEVAAWQMRHGNTPIPLEQWQKWWYANQRAQGKLSQADYDALAA